MGKFILLLISVLLIDSGITHSQDTSFVKPILTKKFDLTTEYQTTFRYNSGIKEIKIKELDFEDCFNISPESDSVFRVNHKYGSDTLLYNSIKEITFYGKNHTKRGLWIGALSGLASAVILNLIPLLDKHPSGEMRGFGQIVLAIVSFPTLTLLGTTIGWIVGANTYDKEIYDFSKYYPKDKKDKAIKILLQHQINF